MDNTILKPNLILSAAGAVIKSEAKKFYRNGIELEKGAIITAQRIERNRPLYEKLYEHWMNYPDLFVDILTPSTSHFKLYFYQRMFMRAIMRHARICTIAPRAFSKSFISILSLYIMCVLRPHIKLFICAPQKGQSAKIAKEKLFEIYDLFPLLKQELVGEGNYGVDYVRLSFRNGSVFDVVSALNSQRGGRRHAGILDEYRDQDADQLNEVVLPLLNVSRPMENGLLNPKEPHQVQIWISSASEKNTFCYDKTIELLELAIINPSKAWIMGCDYRVPVKCGLLPRDFLNEIKQSPTFSESSFAKEYMSRFVGTSSDSWFNYERIMTHRKLVNPEIRAMHKEGVECFYIISVDVARRGCQTVATILKVFPNTGYRMNLVNIFVLGKTENEKVLDKQVIALKKLIKLYQPREVVIDINGLGIFFADAMIQPTFDYATGEQFPAYAFHNREEYFALQPRDAEKILYGIKASPQLNSDMHSTLYAKIDTGQLNFLITEKEARTKIMSTKVGQRMTPEKRNERLIPHELTTHLIDEIMNLKTKPAGANNMIAVEPINKRMTKDKFSALEMGVWRIAQIEQDATARQRNRGLIPRKLTFYRAGGGR